MADSTGVIPRGKTPGQLLSASGCGIARMNGPSPGRGLGPSASETGLNQTPKLSFIEIHFMPGTVLNAFHVSHLIPILRGNYYF